MLPPPAVLADPVGTQELPGLLGQRHLLSPIERAVVHGEQSLEIHWWVPVNRLVVSRVPKRSPMSGAHRGLGRRDGRRYDGRNNRAGPLIGGFGILREGSVRFGKRGSVGCCCS